MSDQVILVNEQDEVIGSMYKVEAHRGPGQLHRAISVFLFRHPRAPELLIQQRSPQKIVGAGQWANAVCGNVRPGESYEACARRRLREELGIAEAPQLTPLTKFRYQVQCNEEFSENEIDQVYAGWFNGAVEPNPEEVAATQWVPWQESQTASEKDRAPWFSLLIQDSHILQQLATFLNNPQ